MQTERVLENIKAVLEAAGSGSGPGFENDRIPARHGGLRKDERGLWPIPGRDVSGALYNSGSPLTAGCECRD